MRQFQAQFDVHSPRWGTSDRCRVSLSDDELVVAKGSFEASCRRVEGRDPEWRGYQQDLGNPFINILENDQIYPPTVIPMALVAAWEKWRGGEVNDQDLEAALRALFDWIDRTARTTPKGRLWQGVF